MKLNPQNEVVTLQLTIAQVDYIMAVLTKAHLPWEQTNPIVITVLNQLNAKKHSMEPTEAPNDPGPELDGDSR